MATFTYDLDTPIGQVRLLAGDTDADGMNRTGGDRTRTDEEIAVLIDASAGDARSAAALLLEGKAAEYAGLAVTVTEGNLRHDYRIRSRRMLEVAASLRSQTIGLPAWAKSANPGPLDVDATEGW